MNKQNIYWCIELSNYHDDYYTLYFKTFEIAKANFDKLAELNKDKAEFTVNENNLTCSWFDPQYNEYSTYVIITKARMPEIHDKIIF